MSTKATNTLGSIALAMSIVGVFTCAALSPLSLALGVAALFSAPRGQAWCAVLLSVAAIVGAVAVIAAAGVLGFGVQGV